MTIDRRRFLGAAVSATAAAASLARAGELLGNHPDSGKLHVATNVYPWLTFYRRAGRDFAASLDESLAAVARSGVDGFEPILNRPEDVEQLAPLLKKHGLEMRSCYVNSVLHEEGSAAESIDTILAMARRAQQCGTRIIVTNPRPIRWGDPVDKNDQQLRTQADSLNTLGRKLQDISMTLAYHNHDMELRQAAREFHHMMLGTDPKLVTLCLDAHWIYRGAGDSNIALFDIVKLYIDRVSELHLRQSRDGTWTEAFGAGDIDYRELASKLIEAEVAPHIVLEQSVESGTAETLSAEEAHRKGTQYARKIFASFAS